MSPTIIEASAEYRHDGRLLAADDGYIIFLGAPIYDDAANIIQAQLLFLESVDPKRTFRSIINSPGGSVSAGLGIYGTMQLVNSDVATICTGLALLDGRRAAGGRQGQAFCASPIRG